MTSPAAGQTRQHTLGSLALAGLALTWGYGWVVNKAAFAYIEPYTFAALRSLLSAGFLFVLLLVMRRPLKLVAPGLTLLVGLLQTTGFIALTMWALAHSGAGKTAVLTYTMPFWLLLLARLMLGERLRGAQWAAVALAFAGLIFVLDPRQLTVDVASLAAVAAGVCWAGSAVAVKILHQRHCVDVLALTAWQMLLGTPLLVVIAAFTWTGTTQWGAPLAAIMTFNVVLANGVAWVLWTFVLRTLAAGAAGIGTLAVPVVGVAAAWLHLGERPSPAEAAGMALIVAALGLLAATETIQGRRRRRLTQRLLSEEGESTAASASGTLDSCSAPSPSTSGTRSSRTLTGRSGTVVGSRSSKPS